MALAMRETDAPAASPPTERPTRSFRRQGTLIFIVVLVVEYLTRVWIRHGAAPLVWNDTADYLALARTGLWSTDRWLGTRPVLMPTVLSAVGMDLDRFVLVQTVFASAAWTLLAVAVASTLRGALRRWLAATAVVGLSLTWAVAMWDQEVLTESLALSTLALVAAAGAWAAQRLTVGRAVALVGAAGLWLAVRDSHVIPVSLIGMGIVGWALVGWWRARSQPATGSARPRTKVAVLTGAYLVALAFLVAGAAQYAHRDRLPLEHVYAVRILPYPQRVAWFTDHGMPEADALSALAPVRPPGQAAFVVLNPAPQWVKWRHWLATDGRSTLLRYAVTHPTYVIDEPRRSPEMVFNNGDGLATYRPVALRQVPGLAAVFYPSVYLTLVLAAFAIPLATARDTLTRAPFIAGAVLAATAVPHALVVWHSDGMESARHLLIPGIQFRLGALLLLTGALLSHPREPKAVSVEITGTGP